MLPATLVELRIRSLREFQCKRKRQVLEIHRHSLVVNQTALEHGDILRSLEINRVCQETTKVVLNDRIGTQCKLNLCCSQDHVIVQCRRLHGNLIVDLQELVIRATHVCDRSGGDSRG